MYQFWVTFHCVLVVVRTVLRRWGWVVRGWITWRAVVRLSRYMLSLSRWCEGIESRAGVYFMCRMFLKRFDVVGLQNDLGGSRTILVLDGLGLVQSRFRLCVTSDVSRLLVLSLVRCSCLSCLVSLCLGSSLLVSCVSVPLVFLVFCSSSSRYFSL